MFEERSWPASARAGARLARIALAAALVAALHCATSPPVAEVSPARKVGPPVPDTPRMPQSESTVRVVPADTSFAVELRTELNSTSDRPGDPIRARVVTPLATIEGETVVATDAELVGTVVAVRREPAESILVRFDRIETRWGAQAVAAGLTRAQPETSIVGAPPKSQGYDAEIERAGGIDISGQPAQVEVPVPIVLPPGVRLQLVLTDDLAVRAPESP